MNARILLLSTCLLVGASAAGQDKPVEPAAAKPNSPAGFERLKALQGEWTGAGLDGNSMPNATARYQLTAGGNAVVETIVPGGDHEMITVFTVEGDQVVLTHYCVTGNHPRMRAKAQNGDTLVFEFDSASNFDAAKDPHMHNVAYTFVGLDEIRSRWNFWAEGKANGDVAEFHLKRKTAN